MIRRIPRLAGFPLIGTLIAFGVVSPSASAQVVGWTDTFVGSGGGEDVPSRAVVDTAGNTYVAGFSKPGKFWAFTKTDSTGAHVWEARYAPAGGFGSFDVAPRGLVVDSTGALYAVGSYLGNNTYADWLVVRINPDGSQGWVSLIDGPAHRGDYAAHLAIDSTGAVVVAGLSPAGAYNDSYVVKYTPTGSITWQKRFTATFTTATLTSMLLGPADSIYLLGSLAGSMNVIKCDSAGNQVWMYTQSASNDSRQLAVDTSGNAYYTRFSASSIRLHKVASNGTFSWEMTYNDPATAYDGPVAVRTDSAGNIFLAAQSGASSSSGKFILIKYDPAGTQQWVGDWISGSVGGIPRGLAFTADGGYVVSGTMRVQLPDTSYYDKFGTVKFNSAGAVSWSRLYDMNRSLNDGGVAVNVDSSDNILVSGSVGSPLTLPVAPDFATVKYAPDGTQLWASTHDFIQPLGSTAYGVTSDGLGNVYVTIIAARENGTDKDVVVIKYDSAGQRAWTVRYGGAGGKYIGASKTLADPSGNVYVTGVQPISEGSSTYEWFTLKLNAAGTQQWISVGDSALLGNSYPNSMALDGAGNVYVTGRTWNGSNGDFRTIKYDSAGQQVWSVDYAGASGKNDSGSEVLPVDGNAYVVGTEEVTEGVNTNSYVRLVKYDSAGQLLWARQGWRGSGFGLARDADGNVYTSLKPADVNTANSIVYKYDPNGNLLWSVGRTGLVAGLIANPLGGAYIALAVDTDPTSYNYSIDPHIYQLDGNGGEVWHASYARSASDWPTGFAVDSCGSAYLTAAGKGQAADDYLTLKFSSTGALVWAATFAGAGNTADDTSGLCLDSAQNVYVTGVSRGETARSDVTTIKYVGDASSDADGDGVPGCLDNCPNIPNPDQADCDHDGKGNACAIADGTSLDCNGNGTPDSCELPTPTVLLASKTGDNVGRFDGVTGAFKGLVVSNGASGLDYANGIEVTPGGNLLVSSVFTNSVIEYKQNGTFVRAFSGGGLSEPVQPRVYKAALLVSGYDSNTIARYDLATGAALSPLVAAGAGGLNGPAGMRITPDGHLLVCSQRNDRVLEYNADTGAFIRIAAQAPELDKPADVIWDGSGNLLVTSYTTYSILKFSPAGAFVGTFASGFPWITSPEGLAYAPNGNLLMVDMFSSRVIELDATTGAFVDRDPVTAGVQPVFASSPTLPDPTYIAVTTIGQDCNSNDIPDSCEADSDGDGRPDACDDCPDDIAKLAAGVCGCGVSDVDTDADATPDCQDGCPTDKNKTAPGFCGCGAPETDTDGDATPNCVDGCPNDPNKTSPGACGCGFPEGVCGVAITDWKSVRTHSGVGALAIVLNASASGNGKSGPVTDPRVSTTPARLVVSFSRPIVLKTPAAPSVVARMTSGGVMGPPIDFSASASPALADPQTLEIVFSGSLLDLSCYTVNLAGVIEGAAGEPLIGDTDCAFRVLVGDVTSDGAVTLGDSLQVKSNVGKPIATVPGSDINRSGAVDLGDALFVKSRVTTPTRQALCP